MESAGNSCQGDLIYPRRLAETRKLVYLALLASTAIVLQALESTFPQPAPWLRLGLANMAVLTVLVNYGFGQGLLVNLVRIVLGALISGSFLGPAFTLSLAGGITSLAAMWLAYRLTGGWLSLIGISLIGAYTHILTQLGVVYTIFIHHQAIFSLVPIMLTAALVSGILNGLGAIVLSRHLGKL